MIAFLTLFLGLVTGIHPVELAVSGPVAAVELLLDGETVGVVKEAPWRLVCDFGPDLEPHELMAVARDRDGKELTRAVQPINLPRPEAEAELLLEGSGGRPAKARLIWHGVRPSPPRSITVTLDGRALVVGDPKAFSLPRLDLGRPHILSASLDFGGGLQIATAIAFGGFYGDDASSRLTAVPLLLEKPGATLSPATIQGRLVKDGEPLRVVAVEEGPADILVVRDHETIPTLALLDSLLSEPGKGKNLRLKRGHHLRLLSPRPVRLEHPRTFYDSFLLTKVYSRQGPAIPTVLAHLRFVTDRERQAQRLTDAVAAAAMRAAAAKRRRAVVLILGETSTDESAWSAGIVRRYLASMRVPLFVWCLGSGASPRVEALRQAWGGAAAISSPTRLVQAVWQLHRALACQRIVWVEGEHLPQEIELSGGLSGLRLLQ